MSATNPTRQTASQPLTDAELRSTLFFAVGVTSESGDRAYRLVVAGDNPATARIEPADNSGYSIGTIQTDLGQHYQPGVRNGENVPGELVDAFQAWARVQHPDWVLDAAQRSQTVSDLGRTGRQINAQNGRALDATVKSHLDAFLATDTGITWVHDRDVAQVDKLMREAMPSLTQSTLYRNASSDDQVRLAAMVGKVYNQNETRAAPLLAALRGNQYASVDAVSAAITGIGARSPDYFETGRDAALRGADVVNALRNSHPDSPMHAAWEHVRDNALTNPTRLGAQAAYPNLQPEYATVRNLFVHYDRAVPFIDALDTGETYRFGALDKANPGRFKGAGLYASGDNFVTWSADGAGHARLGGVWSQIDRSELSRRNNPDQTIDLRRDAQPTPTTLLHLDPNAPALRPNAQTGQQLDQPQVGGRRASSDATEQPLYREAESAVRRLDASLGREYDGASECMTASLACLAKKSGLDRIDQVLLSVSGDHVNAGENVFVVQGDPADPARRMAYMKTQDAVSTPAEQSLAQLSSLTSPVPAQTVTASLEQTPELQGRRMQI